MVGETFHFSSRCSYVAVKPCQNTYRRSLLDVEHTFGVATLFKRTPNCSLVYEPNHIAPIIPLHHTAGEFTRHSRRCAAPMWSVTSSCVIAMTNRKYIAVIRATLVRLFEVHLHVEASRHTITITHHVHVEHIQYRWSRVEKL